MDSDRFWAMARTEPAYRPLGDEEFVDCGIATALRLRLDAPEIARGLIDLFSEEEVRLLRRTGMLPARIVDSLYRQLRDLVLARYALPDKTADGSVLCAYVNREDTRGVRVVYFQLKRLLAEIVHNVVLAIYGAVNLLV